MSSRYGEIYVAKTWTNDRDESCFSYDIPPLNEQPEHASIDDALRWMRDMQLESGDYAVIRVVKVLSVIHRQETVVDIKEL